MSDGNGNKRMSLDEFTELVRITGSMHRATCVFAEVIDPCPMVRSEADWWMSFAWWLSQRRKVGPSVAESIGLGHPVNTPEFTTRKLES
jgi:hypothetical protein